MDDLFAYFENKISAKQLPSLDTLEDLAKNLHWRYSSLQAYHRALLEHNPSDIYSVKLGSPWTPPTAKESSQNIVSETATTKRRSKKKPKSQIGIGSSAEGTKTAAGSGAKEQKKTAVGTENESATLFFGDHSLAKSVMFMHETMISHEASYAVAKGDIGRAYECVKVSQYCGYHIEDNTTHM